MERHGQSVEHRKRKRRRAWKAPISAKFALDEHTKGDIGTISPDLCVALLHRQAGRSEVFFVAITPWRPPSMSLINECGWTILPVRVDLDRPLSPSSIRFPASSPALQSFSTAVQANSSTVPTKGGFEILILEVQPMVLDTIFVKVDADALRRHDEVQRQFGGGFQSYKANGYLGKGKGKAKATSGHEESPWHVDSESTLETRLRSAIRTSLADPIVVHCGDLLPLPLPAHPITHASLPPMKLTLCEPVDQGLVSGNTKIVIDMSLSRKEHKNHSMSRRKVVLMQNKTAEEEDDTSGEQFFSAVETDERKKSWQANGLDSSTTESSTSASSSSDEGSDSDVSGDNMISLNPPTLLSRPSGMASSMTAATPRPLSHINDGIDTPGSVFSSYTATTARQRKEASGRLFHIKPLLTKVREDVLYPSPGSDEDDEARIFVEVKVLARLGCFSGDWVKVSPVIEAQESKMSYLPLSAFGDEDSIPEPFRVLKVYGLAEQSNDSRQPQLKSNGRDQTRRTVPPKPIPNAYVSPILFASLGHATNVRLSPLSITSHNQAKFTRSKVMSYLNPPIAREVTLLRLPTPLSTERGMQAGLLVYLKQYFEHKRRILRKDDLIGIKMNVSISRILSETGAGAGAEADWDVEELFMTGNTENESKKDNVNVAWFVVGQIQVSSSAEDQSIVDPEIWGGAASIEPLTTRMVQIGTHQGTIPSILSNTWEYYLEVKQCPQAVFASGVNLTSKEDLPEPCISLLRRRVRELLAAATSPRATRLRMNPLIILLYSTQRNIGKAYTTSVACADLGLHMFPIDAYDIITEGGAGSGDLKTEAAFRARIDRALSCGPSFTVPVIRHAEALTADRMASALKDAVQDLRALVLTTTDINKIPESVRCIITHELDVIAPNESEREDILENIVNEKGLKLAYDVDLAAVAVKTAALVAGDLLDVVERALVAKKERVENLVANNNLDLKLEDSQVLVRDLLVSGGTAARCITKADFDLAVEAARKNFADSIGAPKIPNVGWADVGGLSNVKDAVMETIQLPLERPELFAKGMKKRSGILFYGPPGTGKTLLAKAIATEFSLNFFSVKGPELLNMYIGESEANVRRVFQRARDARPCVVFFDELDSVAPKRGNQGDSGGVMDRIVSQLLAELDGMSDGEDGGGGVFVIGATNRPDLLDQALLRPGRFDKMLYLGISDTHEKQLTILEALTRKFTLHPDTSLRRVAEALPFTYTGADLYALCSDAMLKAITRKTSAVDSKIRALQGGPVTIAYFFDHYATKEDLAVMVTEEDFLAAQRELTGSVR